jgi:hypothetical protein
VDSFHEAPPFALLILSAEHGQHFVSRRPVRRWKTRLTARTLNFTVCFLKTRVNPLRKSQRSLGATA